MLDPNWFYSSLAQAAAAVVGIIGSVLVVRLQAQRESVMQARQQLFGEFNRIRSGWLGYLNQVKEIPTYLSQLLPRAEQALTAGNTSIQVNQEVSFTGSRGGTPGWHLQVSPAFLAAKRAELHFAQLLTEQISAFTNITKLENLASRSKTFLKGWPDEPPDSKIRSDSVRQDIRTFVKQIDRYEALLGTAGSIAIVWILVWLSVFGVLAPLMFLSAYGLSDKVLLTALFTIGLLALPLLLRLQVRAFEKATDLALPPQYLLQ